MTTTEPVVTADAVRVVLAAAVAAGWITLPSPAINIAASAVALVLSGALTVWTRRRVTPVARIRPTLTPPAGSAPTGPITPPTP